MRLYNDLYCITSTSRFLKKIDLPTLPIFRPKGQTLIFLGLMFLCGMSPNLLYLMPAYLQMNTNFESA